MFAGMDKLGGGVVGDVISERKVSMITMGESAATARYVTLQQQYRAQTTPTAAAPE